MLSSLIQRCVNRHTVHWMVRTVCSRSSHAGTLADGQGQITSPRRRVSGHRGGPFALAMLLALLLGGVTGCPQDEWEPLDATRGEQPRAELNLSLEPGMAFTERTEIESEFEERIGEEEKLQEKHTTKFTLRYKVSEIDDAGGISLDVEIKHIAGRSDFDPTDESYAFDSDAPDRAEAVSRPLTALGGAGFGIVIAADGRVTRVDGIDKLRSAVMAQAEELDSRQRATLEEMLDSVVAPHRLHRGLEMLAYAPQEPVGAGARWAHEFERNRPIPLALEYRFELRSLRRDHARIDFEGRTHSRDEAIKLGAEFNGGTERRVAMEGSAEGQMRIDRATGLIRRANVTERTDGAAFYTEPDGPVLSGHIVTEDRVKVTMERESN